MKNDTSDHPKNEKLPLSDCLVCFDRKIPCLSLCVNTLFLEVLPAIPEKTYKKRALNYLRGFIMLGGGFIDWQEKK